MQFDTSFLIGEMFRAFWNAFGYLFGTWYVWVFVLILLALKLGPEILETRRLRKAGMPEIDRMTGLEFEKFLEIMFSRMGYHVERTSYVGDQGGDLVLAKGGERILVQAKRHRKSIGNKAVQEAAAARPHYKCDRAMVVANQEFTRPARELAKSNGIELWGRKELAHKVLSLKLSPSVGQVEPTPLTGGLAPSSQAVRTPSTSAPTCQRCGRQMVARESARGPFWGCSGFPKCRNIVPIERG